MTERKWKVGDRVVDDLEVVEGVYVVEYVYGQKAMARDELTGEVKEWHTSNFREAPPLSELDAIERDFKDLFARIRAEIERLK